MFWSLVRYVNDAEAYANQDWNLKNETETHQQKWSVTDSLKHLKKFPPSTADSCPHKLNHIWSQAHINLKKLYLVAGRFFVEEVSLNLRSTLLTKCIWFM